MNEKTFPIEKPFGSSIHWTAKVSCGFSVGIALVIPIPFLFEIGSPKLTVPSPSEPLSQLLSWVLPLLQFWLPFLPLFLLFLIFASVALHISSRRQWKNGRGMAIVGVILPAILLLFYGALIVYLLLFPPRLNPF